MSFNRILVTGLVLYQFLVIGCGRRVSYDRQLKETADKVFLTTFVGNGTTGGTSFVVKAPSGKSFIITNNHICTMSKDGNLELHSDNGVVSVHKIINSKLSVDLCILEAGPYSNTGFSVSLYSNVGSKLYIVGYPGLQGPTLTSGYMFGYEIIQLGEPVTAGEKCEGRVQSVDTIFGPAEYCLIEYFSGVTDARTAGGSSGSPVFNEDNEVIGVVFAGNNFKTAIIPLETLKTFLKDY